MLGGGQPKLAMYPAEDGKEPQVQIGGLSRAAIPFVVLVGVLQ